MDHVASTAQAVWHSGSAFIIGLGVMAIPLMVLISFFILNSFRINQEWERSVVYFLGQYASTRGPGLYWIVPFLEFARRINVRIPTVKLETQEAL